MPNAEQFLPPVPDPQRTAHRRVSAKHRRKVRTSVVVAIGHLLFAAALRLNAQSSPGGQAPGPCPVRTTEDTTLQQLAYRYTLAGQASRGIHQLQAEHARQAGTAAYGTALANLEYAQGHDESAIQAVNSALRLDSCYAPAHYLAWRLESLKDHRAEAAAQLELAHRFAPADPQISGTYAAVQQAEAFAASPGAPAVILSTSPGSFYAKSLLCEGLPIRSSASVDSDALRLACIRVQRMLRHRPDVLGTLIRKGGELHLIGDREQTSDLPENRSLRGERVFLDADGARTDIDHRTRGVGTLTSSCGEENLLHLPTDRYREGEDMCVHEFAHEIMNFGLPQREHDEIVEAYNNALARGLWTGAYSAHDPDEFWATLSMWYFGTHGQFLPGRRPERLPAAGPGGLKAYDPDSYALLDRIYRGNTP